jgi:hypothetical protein
MFNMVNTEPRGRMIALTDRQLAIVLDRAKTMPPEKRDIFLRRLGARLRLEGRYDDGIVAKAVNEAAFGLTHEVA